MRSTITILMVLVFMGGMLNAQTEVTIGVDGDYTAIEDDGTIEFNGNATVYEDYVVPLTSVKVPSTDPPQMSVFLNTTYALSFNEGDEVYFTIQMPHSWLGDTIFPHIHWAPSNADDGTVVWGMEYTWIEYNPDTPLTFPASSTETGTEVIPSGGHENKHLITRISTSGIVPSTSQDGISSILVVRLYRGAGTGAITNDGVFGLSFDIHYKRNTFGSREEFVK